DGACHIEAMSIQHILPQFDLDGLDVLFVENIGNLVCPAEFDIGENFRLTVLSIPEGDDKVAKYPLMFTDTDCLALTKCDMLPYFAFDLDRVAADYRGVNPQGPLFQLSARTGEGLDQLAGHLAGRIRAALALGRLPPGTRPCGRHRAGGGVPAVPPPARVPAGPGRLGPQHPRRGGAGAGGPARRHRGVRPHP